MTVVRDISFSVNKEDVLRGLGLGHNPAIHPEINRLIDGMLQDKASLRLIRPALAYDIHDIKNMDAENCYLQNDVILHGVVIPEFFPGAKALAVIVATIGPELENKVTEHFKKGERLQGLILDAIGNSTTESLRSAARNIIMKDVINRGLEPSSPIGPGYPGWSLIDQFNIFQLAPAEAIGVSLTKTAMMVPVKSISMVMGLGENMPVWSESQYCDACSIGQDCLYRYRPGPDCETIRSEKPAGSQST